MRGLSSWSQIVVVAGTSQTLVFIFIGICLFAKISGGHTLFAEKPTAADLLTCKLIPYAVV